jgi:zinc transport system permease protein
LFGDILAVGWHDIIFIWIGVAVILGIVLWRWSNWITATLGDDLAASVGVNAKRESFYLAALLAIVVGLALKIVGALLITALLIIPAATARRFTSTPETMAVLSVGFGSCGQRHRTLGGLCLRLARWPVDGGNRCRVLWNKPTAKRSLKVCKNQLRFVARSLGAAHLAQL